MLNAVYNTAYHRWICSDEWPPKLTGTTSNLESFLPGCTLLLDLLTKNDKHLSIKKYNLLSLFPWFATSVKSKRQRERERERERVQDVLGSYRFDERSLHFDR